MVTVRVLAPVGGNGSYERQLTMAAVRGTDSYEIYTYLTSMRSG